MTDRETASRTTRWVLDQLGLSPKQAHKLLEVPASKLLEVQLHPPARRIAGLVWRTKGNRRIGLRRLQSSRRWASTSSHPFDPSAPAISADKPLIVGSNRDEIVFFHMVSPDKSALSLDEAGLAERIGRLFGTNATRLLTEYRRSRPDASPSEVAVAIESAAFAGAGAIAIAERKAAQGQSTRIHVHMTDHINAQVPGTNYQVGAAHAMDIRLKFDNLAPAESRIRSLNEEESRGSRVGREEYEPNVGKFCADRATPCSRAAIMAGIRSANARDHDDCGAMPRCQRSLSK